MFNNKKAYEYHCFNLFIIYLTYLGWCCSQNCDKCESFGDMVKSVELVVHDFPMALWDFGLFKRFVVRTHQKFKNGRNPVPSWKQAKTTKTRVPSVPKKITLQPEFLKNILGPQFFESNPQNSVFGKKSGFAKKNLGSSAHKTSPGMKQKIESFSWVFGENAPSPSEWSDWSDRMIARSHRAGWDKNMLFFWECHISY